MQKSPHTVLDLDSTELVSPSISWPAFAMFSPSRSWPQLTLRSSTSPPPGRVGGLSGQCCAALEAPQGPEGTSWPRGRIPSALNTCLAKPPVLWLDSSEGVLHIGGVPETSRGGWWGVLQGRSQRLFLSFFFGCAAWHVES